jgi:hypothetical protein
VVSKEIKEVLTWIGVVMLIPRSLDILNNYKKNLKNSKNLDITPGNIDTPTPNPGDLDVPIDDKIIQEEEFGNIGIENHFNMLFGSIYLLDGSIRAPIMTVVLGGEIRSDKFRMMDHIINLANTIILVGEFCLPFIALQKNVIFHKYKGLDNYKIACIELLKKARIRGCRIVLPEDLLIGNDFVSGDMKRICYNTVDNDSRDDGGDYDGDITIVPLCPVPKTAVQFKDVEDAPEVRIYMYVYIYIYAYIYICIHTCI